jgi:peptide/nickel transport system substrate-binding protein
MKQQRNITRREFLRMSALTAAGMAAAACATPVATTQAPAAPTQAPAAPATVAPTAVPASKYKEAPMLAELVKAGKLPAVDARLPKNPIVMTGFDGVGKFGGTWRRAFQGVSDTWGPTKVIDRAWAWFDKNLILQPRLLESWSVSADGKVWTIKLRQGLKWSDGKAEYTTDDLDFWFKNELNNKKLTPGVQTPWSDPDKTMVKFAAVDKYTATFTYGKPKPMFLYNMTRGGTGGGATIAPLPVSPSHYMKQFHEDTTTDKAALEAEIKKGGFADWQTFYMQFARQWNMNPDRPTLGAWVGKNTLKDELLTMERNPYFGGVDSAGNQLPYIDKVTHRLYQGSAPDVLTLRVTNGEIDMQYRHMSIANLPVYKASEAKGDYKVVLGALASHVCFNCNLTTKNKPLAEFFNQRNARIAMSHALNRDNINQLVYNGLLTPRQYSPTKASPQYYEKLTNAYLKYDPALANKMLDEAGYTKKDANGIRLYRDGSGPISFTIEGVNSAGQDVDAAGLVSKDLAAVGIKATYKYVERSLYTQHYTANDIEAGWFGADRAVLPLVPEAIIFRGVQPDRPWCPAWGFWYIEGSKNANAVEPPKDHWIRNIWKIWDEEVAIEPDPAKQTAAFKKILDIWATELPFVTLLGEMPAVTIVKNGFKGYPAGMPNDDTSGDEHFPQGETFYWDDPSKHAA